MVLRTEDPRPEKVAQVDEVRERLSASSGALLTEYRGLTVSELASLRRGLREVGGEYKVYKNTLVRLAVRDLGLEGIDALLVGPTAIAFVDGDAAAAAKVLRDFGRTNAGLVMKGGVLSGSVVSAAQATALADLPSRETLLAQLAGALAAPIQRMAGLLVSLPQNMAYALAELVRKGEASQGASTTPSPADDAATEGPSDAATEASGGEAPEAQDAP